MTTRSVHRSLIEQYKTKEHVYTISTTDIFQIVLLKKHCTVDLTTTCMRMHESMPKKARISVGANYAGKWVTRITEMTVFTKMTPGITGMTLISTEMTLNFI